MTDTTLSTTDVRVAGYARVSTTKQVDEGYSYEEQVRRIEERCASEGWQLVKVYGDPGVSAAKHRPGLDELLSAADRHEVDIVVFRDLDRVGRSVVDLSRIAERLNAAGVRIVSLTGRNVDVTTAEGRLTFNMLSSVAQYEREKIGERVSGSARKRAARGLLPGGRFIKYGFKRQGTDDPPVQVPAEATVIMRIYREAASGRSQREIARGLNDDRIPTQQGAQWEQASVGRMLADPTYKGTLVVKGEICSEGHPWAIVPVELWDQVQALRAARDKSPNRGRGRPPKGNHLFTGHMLRCGSCGGAMSARTYDKGHEVYHCRSRRDRGLDTCSMPPSFDRALIDSAVLKFFNDQILDIEATRVAYERTHSNQVEHISELLSQAHIELMTAEQRLARMRTAFMDAQIDASEWAGFKSELTSDIQASTAKIAQLTDQHERLITANAIDAESDLLVRLAELRRAIIAPVQQANDIAALRAVILRVFESFTLHVRAFCAQDLLDEADLPTPREIARQIGSDALVLSRSAGTVTFLVPQIRSEYVKQAALGGFLHEIEPQALKLSAQTNTQAA